MIQPEMKELDNLELIEELNRKKDILDLCVHGVLNEDYKSTAEGLYWIKEEMKFLTDELENRLLKKQS